MGYLLMKSKQKHQPWWPNMCVIIESGSPMPLTISATKIANAAIKKAMENGK